MLDGIINTPPSQFKDDQTLLGSHGHGHSLQCPRMIGGCFTSPERHQAGKGVNASGSRIICTAQETTSTSATNCSVGPQGTLQTTSLVEVSVLALVTHRECVQVICIAGGYDHIYTECNSQL